MSAAYQRGRHRGKPAAREKPFWPESGALGVARGRPPRRDGAPGYIDKEDFEGIDNFVYTGGRSVHQGTVQARKRK